MRTERELLEALRLQGSTRTEAWSELVDRFSPRMYAVGRSFNLDKATAEDLVQTAWLRLIERIDQLRDESSLGPWLCAVVRNDARKLVTRTRTIATGEEFERRIDPTLPPAEAALERNERASALRSAFATIGEECRQLLRLTMADPPLSYDEIAAATGRPRGSLGPTRQRCLDQLRRKLPAGIGP